MATTLIDTSVLGRLLERDSPKGVAAEKFLRACDATAFATCAQVLMEFWVVATRPVDVNGYGLSPNDANKCIADLLNSFSFLSDPPDLFERWRDLTVTYQVRGKPAHDARLVALMRAYGGTRVLTFNPRDFRRFGNIELVIPSVN